MNNTTNTRTEFTTSAFERTHGTAPSGFGSWAFQASATRVAFDDDLEGDVVFVSGTFAKARSEARAEFHGERFVAVLG